MGKRGLRHAAIVLLVPVALSACSGGGGGTVSAADYVSAVCSHVKTWITDIRSGVSKMEAAANPGTSPQQGQQLLRSFLDGTISSTDTMISGVKDAGVPDVSNGQSVATTLLNALERARSALADARTRVDSLPTNSPTAFQHAASALGTTVQSNMRQIGTSLAGLHSPELEAAAKKAPACSGTI